MTPTDPPARVEDATIERWIEQAGTGYAPSAALAELWREVLSLRQLARDVAALPEDEVLECHWFSLNDIWLRAHALLGGTEAGLANEGSER